jgi:hypothetical protein
LRNVLQVCLLPKKLTGTMQVFDVLNFDLIVMLRLDFVPSCAEWIYKVENLLSVICSAWAGTCIYRLGQRFAHRHGGEGAAGGGITWGGSVLGGFMGTMGTAVIGFADGGCCWGVL